MSRYADAHPNPAGPGDARPTALQVLQDEGVVGKLVGKAIVITGCSSGIGIETARVLSLTGARLLLTAQSLDKARTALSNILEPGRVELIEMDNNSLDIVREAAKAILRKSSQVNILINHASIMVLPQLEHTKDGFEKQFGVNNLSHFLLFQLLKPALLASATPDFSSRVVSLSSSAHHVASINASNNHNFERLTTTIGLLVRSGEAHLFFFLLSQSRAVPQAHMKYPRQAIASSPWRIDGQSKTANTYMTNDIERRYGSQEFHANSVHSGMIATGFMHYMDPEVLKALTSDRSAYKLMKSPEQGAATTVWAAIGKDWENKGGQYLSECDRTMSGNDKDEIGGVGVAGHAYDQVNEARLWKDSLKMVGMEDEQ